MNTAMGNNNMSATMVIRMTSNESTDFSEGRGKAKSEGFIKRNVRDKDAGDAVVKN